SPARRPRRGEDTAPYQFAWFMVPTCETAGWAVCATFQTRFMLPMHAGKSRKGFSMTRTYSACALPSKAAEAAEGRRTPRRWRVGQGHPNFRQVLECAAPAA